MHFLITKNSRWYWARFVTCFTKLDNHNWISLFRLNEILKLLMMCWIVKTHSHMNNITVKICCLGVNSSEHPIILTYFCHCCKQNNQWNCERFEPKSYFKSRLSLIVRVNVVLTIYLTNNRRLFNCDNRQIETHQLLIRVFTAHNITA